MDKSGNLLLTDEGDDIYLGSVFPDHNLAWRNDFSWKGVNLGLLFTARLGGICYSATQANLDLYGVSEASAAARDAGGVWINGREMVDAQKWYQAIGSQSGLPQYYTYSATNFRLQELSLGYTFPAKWFRDKMRMTVSFVGRNLWMIYCEAPFDPEAVATTGLNYQGIDYFMMPSLGASASVSNSILNDYGHEKDNDKDGPAAHGGRTAALASCTGDFEDINRNPNQVTEEQMEALNYKTGTKVRTLQSLVIPVQEHMYQFNESLTGGPFAGYIGATVDTWQTKFETYNPSADWRKWPFANVITETYTP